jgi:hypothetical protein
LREDLGLEEEEYRYSSRSGIDIACLCLYSAAATANGCMPGGRTQEVPFERALSVPGEIPGGVTNIDSAGRQRIEVSRLVNCAEIRKCTSSEVVSKGIKLLWSAEEIDGAFFILVATDVQ